MKMAKSTYYFELNRVDAVAEKNGVLLSEIKKIFHENKGRYGVRRIYQELCRRGHVVNHKRVQRLMHVNGLILHSDQGWQYQHAFYQQSLEERGIIQSMSRKGNCYDNCIIETFFGRMKNEMFYGFEKEYSTFKEFQTAVEEYIDYYNNKRIQEKTKWMSPVQYRETSMRSA